MKKILLLTILMLGAVSFYFLNQDKAEPQSKALTEKASDEVQKTPVRQSLKESRYKISGAKKSSEYFPKECESELKDLVAMTMEEYRELALKKESFKNFFGDACGKKLLGSRTFRDLVKNSGCELFQNEKEVKEDNCLTMMFLLKAYAISDYTQSKSSREMNSQELAANFVKMFFGIDKLTKDSFLGNLDLINRLHEMHPQDPDVLEAYLGYLMIGSQVTGESSVEGRINELLEEPMGNSFKVDRMQVLRNVLKDDLGAVKKDLTRLEALYPREPELAYYQAAYYWKKGNREMANSFLDKAISLGKNCSYCTPGLYQSTKEKLARAKDGDGKLFSISIGLNFENL